MAAQEYLNIIGHLLLKYPLIFLRVFKIFDELNTDRRVNISPGISKEGTQ